MKCIYCGSVQRFIDLIEWKYEVQLVLKRGQLRIIQSNKRRNPGLLGDYSGIHDANHVQVWCRRHLQSNQSRSGGDNKPRKCAKLFQFAASFLLAIIRWTQQTNKCAKLYKFSVFFVFKLPGCWSLVPELIGSSRQSPPIQWSWKILLTTRQSWQWRSSIDDHSPSQNFQCRLPG